MKKLFGSMLSLALLCANTSAAMAIPAITTTIDVTPESTLTDQEQESLSIAAGRLLIHVDQARQDLKSKKAMDAKKEIEKAITLGEIIKSVLPTYTVKTEVKSSNHDYVDQSKVKPLLVTIVDQFSEWSLLEPVRVAKRTGHDQTPAQTTPADVLLQESRAQLDVGMALTALQQAQTALEQNKTETADIALRKLETDIDFEYVAANIPLSKAQTDLMLAKKAMQQSKWDTAKIALKKAADALEEYTKTAGSNVSAEATKLRQEIESVAENLQSNAKFAEESTGKWWQKIAGWQQK